MKWFLVTALLAVSACGMTSAERTALNNQAAAAISLGIDRLNDAGIDVARFDESKLHVLDTVCVALEVASPIVVSVVNTKIAEKNAGGEPVSIEEYLAALSNTCAVVRKTLAPAEGT